MKLLKNTSPTAFVNRYIMAGMVLVMALTNTQVQTVAAADSAKSAVFLDASAMEQTTRERGIVVPKGKAIKDLPVAANKPVRKWNMIDAPDLETKAGTSNEPAVRTMRVPITAYTSDPAECDSTPFTTANGSQVRDGVVAANFLPFGTRIRIPEYFGDKVFEVHDRMNTRYQQRVDIWMLKKVDARAWGLRNVTIEILPS
jgi:3D (Asp-Asp-Asp) domain-containing protein